MVYSVGEANVIRVISSPLVLTQETSWARKGVSLMVIIITASLLLTERPGVVDVSGTAEITNPLSVNQARVAQQIAETKVEVRIAHSHPSSLLMQVKVNRISQVRVSKGYRDRTQHRVEINWRSVDQKLCLMFKKIATFSTW